MMKVYIIGSVKIDSWWRKKLFLNSLDSLETIRPLFSWNFNIVGKYSEFCKKEVMKRYQDAIIAHNNTSSYYDVVKKQISWVIERDSNPLLFFFMEDHWFICPHKNLFFYVLEEFKSSKADVLRITHLAELWARENVYKITTEKPLYKEYLMDSAVLKNVWQKHPGAYITTMPGIFKKDFTLEVLENNKSLLNSKKPGGFELYGQKAEEFVAKRSFITMVPTFYVLREVFFINQDKRAMDITKALKIIKLRDTPDLIIKSWRRILRLIMAPRTLLGIIKRSIQK